MYQVDAGSLAPLNTWSVPDAPTRGATTPARRRRAGRALLAIACIAANALAIHQLFGANATSVRLRTAHQETQAGLNARRVELSILRSRSSGAAAQLEHLTAQRDRLAAKAVAASAATVAARTQSKTAKRRAAAHQARIDALSQCLAVLHRAMNTLSVGDTFNGDAEVEKLGVACAALK